VYKNVSETPPKNDCGDWSRDYEPYLELDVHLPQNKSSTGAGEGGKYPLLFHVHGGGWSVGDKSLAAMSFGHWTSRGYAIVSSQYSLRCYGHDAATMQADLADAFHFVEERADELNLDFSRVTAIGESAGGHLAMLLGYTLKATSDPAKNAFRSVFNIYGLADMERWDRDGWTSGGSKGTAFPCDEEVRRRHG
jgi:acetyl esterase/lipase